MLGIFERAALNEYRFKNWLWLYNMIESRKTSWYTTWLSLGGKLTLVKVIHVYWQSLAYIPKGILHKIGINILSFAWTSKHEKEKMALVKMVSHA